MKENLKSKLIRRDFFKKSAAGIIGFFGGGHVNMALGSQNNFKKPSERMNELKNEYFFKVDQL